MGPGRLGGASPPQTNNLTNPGREDNQEITTPGSMDSLVARQNKQTISLPDWPAECGGGPSC